MILSPFSEAEMRAAGALLPPPSLSPVAQHLLKALRVNAQAPDFYAADGGTWRYVAIADAGIDVDLIPQAARHFGALTRAGLFEARGVAGGLVRIANACEARHA